MIRRLPAFAPLLLLAWLTACAPSQERLSLLARVQSKNLDPALYAKVEQRQSLTIQEIAALLRQGVISPDVQSIINASGAVYKLGTSEIEVLRSAGASPELIDWMLRIHERYIRDKTRFEEDRRYLDPLYYDPYRYYYIPRHKHPHGHRHD
jgi:hypothetical protein